MENADDQHEEEPRIDNRVEVDDGERRENVIPEDVKDHPAVSAFVITKASFLITDPRLPGNPIIYASPGFLTLTGYPIERVLGRNCRFLQGPGTDPAAVARMREAIDQGKDISVTLLNYREDSTTFWNQVLISAVYGGDKSSELHYYLGVQHKCRPPDGTGQVLAAA